jgi:hypothetical protein
VRYRNIWIRELKTTERSPLGSVSGSPAEYQGVDNLTRDRIGAEDYFWLPTIRQEPVAASVLILF